MMVEGKDPNRQGMLFALPARGLDEQRKERRATITERCQMAADIANKSNDFIVLWCNLNDESESLKNAIKDSVEVKGSDKPEHKEAAMIDFQDNKIKCLVTKPSIAGFGLNLQHTHNMVFVGLDDSFEKFYQAIRRQFRFGQKHQVNVHIVISDGECAIKANIERKQEQHNEMTDQMVIHMRVFMRKEIIGIGKKAFNLTVPV